jgi:hypothetical protein
MTPPTRPQPAYEDLELHVEPEPVRPGRRIEPAPSWFTWFCLGICVGIVMGVLPMTVAAIWRVGL